MDSFEETLDFEGLNEPTDVQLKPGFINERYQLLSELGRGGCGSVHVAQDHLLERKVAVKRLHLEMSAQPDQVERFLTEAQLTSSLSDPHILTLYDCGRDHQGRLFLVTELLEGESLEQRLQSQKSLSIKETLDLFIPLCGALQLAHEKGIIHRDLKPANLFITTRRGVPILKLLDFGIAKVVEGANLTATGHFVGTPHYLAPEQARAERDIGPAVDWYAFGVTLFQCLTAHLPFQAASILDLLNKIVGTPPPSLRSISDDQRIYPFQEILDQLLEKDAKTRLADADRVHELLLNLKTSLEDQEKRNEEEINLSQTFTDPSPISYNTYSAPKRSTRSLISISLLVLSGLLILGGLFSFLSKNQDSAIVQSSIPQPAPLKRGAGVLNAESPPSSTEVRKLEIKPPQEPKALDHNIKSKALAGSKSNAPAGSKSKTRTKKKKPTSRATMKLSLSPMKSSYTLNEEVRVTALFNHSKVKASYNTKLGRVSGNTIRFTHSGRGVIKGCYRGKCDTIKVSVINIEDF